MQASKINVDKNLKETVKHGTSSLPIAVYTDDFQLFDDGYIRLHWHYEFQFSYVLNEKIIFFIDGKEILLKPGEGIIINSNILHEIKPYEENCRMFTINFDPSIIGGSSESLVYQKYVQPFIEFHDLKYVLINKNIVWQEKILDNMNKIFDLSNTKPYLYELEMINNINIIWTNLIKEMKDKIETSRKPNSYDEERIQKCLQFIHEHYYENVLLDNIASEASISKSECCRCFKRILKSTPFDYLMKYRISKSLDTLINSNESISTIALNSGFSSMSYYSKIFKKYMNCTPSQYRKSRNSS